MPKRNLDPLIDQIRQMAARLTEGDDGKGNSQLASDLRESGIDPDALRRRFYEAARAIAAKEMTAGRPVPLSVEQAIEQMAPEDVMPSNTKAAEAKMARWIDSFSAPCSVPADLEAARAFRKRGDVAENEQAELDELERQLKDEIKKEHEGEA